MKKDIDQIKKDLQFLSGITYMGKDYVCIIQNSDDKILSFYDFDAIKTDEEKRDFLELGETWMWESNRLIPINIFLHNEMRKFNYVLRTVMTKDVTVNFGMCTSLSNILQKRIKRRQITLVKKLR